MKGSSDNWTEKSSISLEDLLGADCGLDVLPVGRRPTIAPPAGVPRQILGSLTDLLQQLDGPPSTARAV